MHWGPALRRGGVGCAHLLGQCVRPRLTATTFACFQASNPSALSCVREHVVAALARVDVVPAACAPATSAGMPSGTSATPASPSSACPARDPIACAAARQPASSSVRTSSLTADFVVFFFSATFSLRFLPLLILLPSLALRRSPLLRRLVSRLHSRRRLRMGWRG